MKQREANANFNCNESHRITGEEVLAHRNTIEAVGRNRGLDVFSLDDLVSKVVALFDAKRFIFEPSKGTVDALVARVASRKAVDMLRKQARGPVVLDDETLCNLADAADCYDPFEAYNRKARKEWVHRGIREMYHRFPSREAVDAFLLFDMFGHSANDIAHSLGVTEHFVNDAVYKGRKRLRGILLALARNDGPYDDAA